MNGIWTSLAILVAAGLIAGSILLRPSPFQECVAVLSSDIARAKITSTIDPRDLEAQAARECSGFSGPSGRL